MIGRHHEIVFGKHSGVHGVAHLAERSGLALPESSRKAVLERIKSEAERRKGNVAESEVLAWAREAAETSDGSPQPAGRPLERPVQV